MRATSTNIKTRHSLKTLSVLYVTSISADGKVAPNPLLFLCGPNDSMSNFSKEDMMKNMISQSLRTTFGCMSFLH